MDFLAHVRSESARFLEAMSAVPADKAVPSCPEWQAADLLWHLTEVQWFWGTIVAEQLAEPESTKSSKPQRPGSYEGLLDLGESASKRLAGALDSAPDEAPVWTWAPGHETVGFVRRRQAHEALIHRADAELTAGMSPHLDSELAADGIDEILRIFIGGVPDWAHFEPEGHSIRIHATDVDRRWGVAFGRLTGQSPTTGKDYDLETVSVGLDATESEAAVAGPASHLDLWLWGRAPMEGLDIAGDTRLVDRLRAVAADSTQ